MRLNKYDDYFKTHKKPFLSNIELFSITFALTCLIFAIFLRNIYQIPAKRVAQSPSQYKYVGQAAFMKAEGDFIYVK